MIAEDGGGLTFGMTGTGAQIKTGGDQGGRNSYRMLKEKRQWAGGPKGQGGEDSAAGGKEGLGKGNASFGEKKRGVRRKKKHLGRANLLTKSFYRVWEGGGS